MASGRPAYIYICIYMPRHPRSRAVRKLPPPPPPHDFIQTFGGVAESADHAFHNTAALNHSFHSLVPGETLVIPRGTFYVGGGVEGVGLRDVTIRIDGRLLFSSDTSRWPHYSDGVTHRAGLAFWDAQDLTLTSSARGELDGNGRAWWSVPGIGYLMHQEHRPRLLTIANSRCAHTRATH